MHKLTTAIDVECPKRQHQCSTKHATKDHSHCSLGGGPLQIGCDQTPDQILRKKKVGKKFEKKVVKKKAGFEGGI
jgi:hypothetical protein